MISQNKMNQTEIPNIPEPNSNCENLPVTERTSKIKSGITTVFGRNTAKDITRTPKLEHSNTNLSSNRINRASSSKGIKIVTSRPSSCEKQLHDFDFNADENQTISKIEKDDIFKKMRQELQLVNSKYEQKMNQQLAYQYNLMTSQMERLKDIIRDNDAKLAKKDVQILELQEKHDKILRKTESRLTKLDKQINQLKQYYQKCYDYTLWRVNDVDLKVGSIFQYINEETLFHERIQFSNQISYLKDMISDITVKTSAKTSSLKLQLEEQLHHFVKKIENHEEDLEKVDELVDEMKRIKYGNENLFQYMRDMKTFILKQKNQIISQQKQDGNMYEQKYNEILKRVNGTCIQVELIKSIFQKTSEEEEEKNSQTIFELSGVVNELEKKLQSQKEEYEKKIKEIEENKGKSHPKIGELEHRIFVFEEEQKEYEKQISGLNLKLAYFQKKSQKASERDFSIQSTLAEAFSEEIVKEKLKMFEEDKKQLRKTIEELKERNKKLDEENFLLAEKLAKLDEEKYKNLKIQTQFRFNYSLLQAEIETLSQTVESLRVENDVLKEENGNLSEELGSKTEVLQNLTEQMEVIRHHNQSIVSNLTKMSEVKNENKNLKEEVHSLENDLHEYATTFENQSMVFRSAIQNLQKEKSQMGKQLENLQKQNTTLKLDLEMTQSAQSFFANSSTLSIRKTSSSQDSIRSSSKKLAKSNIFCEQKYNRLKETIEKFKEEKPLVCEIDETGYLKQQKTGMYIVDQRDNLFQLTEKELQTAIEKGLIVI